MKYLFLNLLIINVLSASWAADNFFSTPAYCKHYDQIYGIREGRIVNDDTGVLYTPNVEVFSECINDLFVTLSIDNLLEHWSLVNDNFLSRSNTRYNNHLKRHALELLIRQVSSYEGLAQFQSSELDGELLSCLEDIDEDLKDLLLQQRQQGIQLNNALTNEYLDDAFEKALLAQTLVHLIDQTREEFEREKNRVIGPRGQRQSREIQEVLENDFTRTTETLQDALRTLSLSSPLLFTTSNRFSITNWFNSQLETSSFQRQLIGEIPTEILDTLKSSFDSEEGFFNFQSFDEIASSSDLRPQIDQYKEQYLSSHRDEIKLSLNEVNENYIDGIYENMASVCEEEDSPLHLNQELVNSLSREIFQNNTLSDEEKTEELLALQAWHCYAWRESPPSDIGGLTWARIGGFGSLGVGALLWLSAPITGVGAIGGTYFMAAGGALLTGQSVADHINYRPLHQQYQTSYHLGWADRLSLAHSRDRQLDIASEIALDATGGLAGAGARFVRLPSQLNVGRIAQNRAARESDDPVADVDGYYSLIMDRHEGRIPTGGFVDDMSALLRRFTGSEDAPRVLLRDGDFSPMLATITRSSGNPADRNIAFADLQARIDRYNDYPERVRDAVRQGRNAREILDANLVYGQHLRAHHFRRDPRTGEYPQLPELPDGYEVFRTPNDSLALRYRVVQRDESGREVLVDRVEDFTDYESFLSFVGDENRRYQMAYSFNVSDEVLRRSDIFNELDDQARLYRELSIVRSSLIRQGNNIDPQTGYYANLSDRQNLYIEQLNDLLYHNPELLPRSDAVRAFSLAENRAERRALLLPNFLRTRNSKYSEEAQQIVNSGLPRARAILAPMGLYTGFSSTGVILTSTSERLSLRYAYEDLKEALREASRSFHAIIYQDAPVRFTAEEMNCARQARGWSVENACLLELLNQQVMIHASIRERREEDYNMHEDEELIREVRSYIRDFYQLREFFNEGKRTEISQSQMREVANEAAEQAVVEYIREYALENGIRLIENEELAGRMSVDPANELRRRLFNFESDPDDAINAYTEILESFQSYQGSFIDNPEMSPELRSLIDEAIQEMVQD